MSIIGLLYNIQIKIGQISMDPHRLSQTTLPSTHHSPSSQQQPNTNTSLHNSALSHNNSHLHDQSLPADSHSREQTQEMVVAQRTNSQRLPENQEDRIEVEQEDRKMCKSQGQRSGHIDRQQAGQQVKEDMAEQATKIQASWGAQNLLEGNSQPSEKDFSSQAPIFTKSQQSQNAQSSQASEYLLDFSYPIDQPYNLSSKAINGVVIQQRCESQSKIKDISEEINKQPYVNFVQMELQNKPNLKQMNIQAKGTQKQQIMPVDNPMEIQDVDELQKKIQRSIQLQQPANQQMASQRQNYVIGELQNRVESVHSIDRSDIFNSSEAVQLDSQYRYCNEIPQEPKSHPIDSPSGQPQSQQLVESSHRDKLKSSSSIGKAQSDEYGIEVKEVNEQRINSHIKNNDIYGIQSTENYLPEKQQRIQNNEKGHNQPEESAKLERRCRTSEDREDRAVLGGYYDASEASNLSKSNADNSKQEEELSAENKHQQSSFHLNETKPTEYSEHLYNDQFFPKNLNQPEQLPNLQQSEPPHTLESIIDIMQALIQDQRSSEVRFSQFNSLINPHVDLMFMRAADSIGEAILSDGKNATLLCTLYSLKEEQKYRRPFERYLICIIDQKVKTNRGQFEEYRRRSYPQRTIGIVQSHSEKIESKSPQIRRQNEPDLQANEPSAKLEQPSETQSRIGASIYVNEPSIRSGANSILKSCFKPSIAEPQTQGPIRRYKLDISDLQSENKNDNLNMSVQPKKTRRGKPARKVKISATDQEGNKSTVKRDTDMQERKQSMIRNELKRLGIDYSTFIKSQPKREKKLNDQVKKEQHLGSGYTFLQTKENDHIYLQPVRASHRIQSRSRLKNNPTQNKSTRKSQKVTVPSSSPKRSPTPPKAQSRPKKNRSSRKTNDFLADVGEEQYLNVNLIKNYFREINMEVPCTLENIQDYSPISKEDSYITDLLVEYKQLHRQEEDLHLDYEKSQSAMEGTRDLQELEEITMTNRRIEESQNLIAERKKQIRKKLSEYYETPIEVQRVVDPNINNHGIYALLQLTKRSALIFKARYFVTQISCIEYAPRHLIDEDMKTIPTLVEKEQQDNIGSIALNEGILKLIEQARLKKEAAQQISNRQNNHK